MLLLLLLVNYYCPLQSTSCTCKRQLRLKETRYPSIHLSVCLFICLSLSLCLSGGSACVSVYLQRSLVNDWTPTGLPLARPISVIFHPHWLLSGRPTWNQPIAAAPYAPIPRLPALKEPPCLQWRLNPLTDLLSLSALSPLLHPSVSIFYSLFLYPSLPSSLFFLLF